MVKKIFEEYLVEKTRCVKMVLRCKREILQIDSLLNKLIQKKMNSFKNVYLCIILLLYLLENQKMWILSLVLRLLTINGVDITFELIV